MSRLCSALQRNQHDHRRHGYKKRYVYRQFSVSLSFLSDPTPPHAFTCCMRPRERTSLWGHSQQLNTVVGSMALSEGHWFADRHLWFYTVPSSGPAFSIQQDQTLSFASRLTKSQQTGCQGHTTDSQCDWPFNAEPLYPQAIQSGSETIKSKGREGVSGGWVLRMSDCRSGQITLFGLFAWLQFKGPICKKVDFRSHLQLPKMLTLKDCRSATIPQRQYFASWEFLQIGTLKNCFTQITKKKQKTFTLSSSLPCKCLQNYFWNSMLFIGWLQKFQRISQMLCA